MTSPGKPPHGLFVVPFVFLPLACGYLLSYVFRTINGSIADELMREGSLDAGSLALLTSIYFLALRDICHPDRSGAGRVRAAACPGVPDEHRWKWVSSSRYGARSVRPCSWSDLDRAGCGWWADGRAQGARALE